MCVSVCESASATHEYHEDMQHPTSHPEDIQRHDRDPPSPDFKGLGEELRRLSQSSKVKEQLALTCELLRVTTSSLP